MPYLAAVLAAACSCWNAAAQDRLASNVPAGHQQYFAPMPAPCCEAVKVCQPRPDIKKTVKVTYGCKAEDYCVPRCGLCTLYTTCTSGGECLRCGKVRTRNILIKKIKNEECD